MWNQVLQSLHESMARVISRIAMLLPGILAFVVAILFFLGIAWLLAHLARAFLKAVRFDERLAHGTQAIAEWSPNLHSNGVDYPDRLLGHSVARPSRRARGVWSLVGRLWSPGGFSRICRISLEPRFCSFWAISSRASSPAAS